MAWLLSTDQSLRIVSQRKWIDTAGCIFLRDYLQRSWVNRINLLILCAQVQYSLWLQRTVQPTYFQCLLDLARVFISELDQIVSSSTDDVLTRNHADMVCYLALVAEERLRDWFKAWWSNLANWHLKIVQNFVHQSCLVLLGQTLGNLA